MIGNNNNKSSPNAKRSREFRKVHSQVGSRCGVDSQGKLVAHTHTAAAAFQSCVLSFRRCQYMSVIERSEQKARSFGERTRSPRIITQPSSDKATEVETAPPLLLKAGSDSSVWKSSKLIMTSAPSWNLAAMHTYEN